MAFLYALRYDDEGSDEESEDDFLASNDTMSAESAGAISNIDARACISMSFGESARPWRVK